MNRREFAFRSVAGLASLSAAGISAQPLGDRRSAGRTPQKETLTRWRLRVIRRVPVAAGAPRHRAFPGIEKLRNGDILVAYREGSDHWRTPDGTVRLARSRDGGLTWSEPETLLESKGVNYGTHSGISQLSDGSILLPAQSLSESWGPESQRYALPGDSSGRGPRRITSYLLRSSDDGHTWSRPEAPNVDGLSSDFWWNVYGKIYQIESSQTVLWPISRQKKGEVTWRTGLLVSRDLGHTWAEYRDVAVGLADEKNLVRIGGGRLLALIRDLRAPYVLQQAESTDDGMTWLPYCSSGFLGHCPSILRTRKGALLCTHRIVDPGAARGVGLHYSFDEGRSWHGGEPLYLSPEPANGDCAYAGMVQLNSGQILCVYYTTYRNRNSEIEGVILEET